MPPNFEGDSADEVWLAAAHALAQGSQLGEQPSRDGPTRELLHAVLTIRDPRKRWVFSRKPALNPAFAIAETFWILLGRNDAALPVFFNRRFPRYSGPGPTYSGAYGYRLRHAFQFDQLERAFNVFQRNPDSRQVVLQIWDPPADFPTVDGSPRRGDIPCNVCSLLKVRGGQLYWTQILRSNDLFLGVPHNIVQFTILQEILAGWLELKLGTYTHLSDSLHVYIRDLQSIMTVEEKMNPSSVDTLSLPIAESRSVLVQVGEALDALIAEDLNIERFHAATDLQKIPRAYANLLSIMAADSARRRGWTPEMDQVIACCSNPELLQLWQNWLDRVSQG